MAEFSVSTEVVEVAIDAYLSHTRPRGGGVIDAAMKAAIQSVFDKLGLREEEEWESRRYGRHEHPTGRVRLVSDWHLMGDQLKEFGSDVSTFDDICRCSRHCGDDGYIDGAGVCKGLPSVPEPPLVEVVVNDRRVHQ